MLAAKFDNLVNIFLIVVTVVTVSLHTFSLNKSFIFNVGSGYKTHVISDTANGGLSTAQLTQKNGAWILDCHIVQSDYAWPFCEITFPIGLDDNDIPINSYDFSGYTHARVTAKYLGPNKSSFRFQFRTFNPEYSKLDDETSWKYNGVEYWPLPEEDTVEIPFNAMQVATWWLWEKEIPIAFAGPEFDQILVVELATGNNLKPGHYQIELKEIEFVGKIFTNQQVYGSITIMWIFAALFNLALNLKRSKTELVQTQKRASELKQLNKLLNVESQELKNLAERDPLTGALNRKGIEHVFTNEIKVMSLMFIDIDHFKQLNDSYGHAAGDEVLKVFVQLISQNCRSTDFIARWGGEEFLLICPNTNLHEAQDLAESLCVLIAESELVDNIKVTASFGVAQKGEETTSDLIKRADLALYAAKAQGRNRVVVSENS